MPTIDNQDHLPSAMPGEHALPDQDMVMDDTTAPANAQSEVAMRINLLGKLIIPPSAP